jgi:hypothetical protein
MRCWEDKIKMDLKKIKRKRVDWVCVAQFEDLSTILNFWVPYSAQYSLTEQLLSIQKDSDS